MTGDRSRRGIALISVLLASVLLLAALGLLVDLASVGLRRATEDLRGLQARAGADAGVAWVRTLLYYGRGDLKTVLRQLKAASNRRHLDIDSDTAVDLIVSLQSANPGPQNNHLDVNLQTNRKVDEVPLQLESTATVSVGGIATAHRTTIALLRVFLVRPYSEVVGVIDTAGPQSGASPGDAAGQPGDATTSDLRIHTYTLGPSGYPKPADSFIDQLWSDGGVAGTGLP